MDNLPIPNMRSSWVAALVNTVIVFFIYYLFLFGYLLEEYRGHFIPGSFNESEERLIVWVDVPRYFYAAGPATVHIHVKNESRNSVNNVKVYLITQPDPETPTLLIPNVFNTDVYSSLIEFPIIEPLSTSTGRTTFVTQSNTSITSVLLKVGENEPQQLFAIPEIRFVESSPKALQIDFLEHILLPPWSNGFILALILLSTFLVRVDKEEKVEEKIFDSDSSLKPNPVWRGEFVKDWLRSSFIFGIMVFITLIIYILLGSADATIPLIVLVLFACLIFVRGPQTLETRSRYLSPIIIFLGFVFAILAVILVFPITEIFISPLGKIFWILLGIEGLAAFIWYYGRQLVSEANRRASDKNSQKLVESGYAQKPDDLSNNNALSSQSNKKNKQKK